MQAPAAQTIACPRCGGTVGLNGLAPRVRCPHCGNDQDVPRQKLAQLAQYQRSAGDLAARIAGEEGQRAQWQRWYGRDGKVRGGYLGSFLIFGAMIVVYAVGMVLRSTDLIDDEVLGRALPIGMFATFAIGMGVAVARGRSRSQRTPVVTPRVGAVCPRCGAPRAFEAGKLGEQCAHCGSSLVAGTAIIQQAIGVARADLRRAAMARYRVERSAMATLYRSSAASIVPYIALGSFLPLTAGCAVAITFDFLTNEHFDAPPVAIALVWLLALCNGAPIVLIARWRSHWRRRWRAVADGVAARLGGRVCTTPAEWVGWLNGLWAGPYAVTSLLPGPYFHAVTGGVGSFPVAFDLDPTGASSQVAGPRADVLVAACPPGAAETVPLPADVLQRARAFGFVPSSCTGGFAATGCDALPALRKGEPGAAADAVVAVARLLVEWATRVGATPATPMAADPGGEAR